MADGCVYRVHCRDAKAVALHAQVDQLSGATTRVEQMSGATLVRIHRRTCCQQCQSVIAAWFGNYLESNLATANLAVRNTQIQSELGIEHSAELIEQLESLQQRIGTGFLHQMRKLLLELAKEAMVNALENWAHSSGQDRAIVQQVGDQQETVCVL